MKSGAENIQTTIEPKNFEHESITIINENQGKQSILVKDNLSKSSNRLSILCFLNLLPRKPCQMRVNRDFQTLRISNKSFLALSSREKRIFITTELYPLLGPPNVLNMPDHYQYAGRWSGPYENQSAVREFLRAHRLFMVRAKVILIASTTVFGNEIEYATAHLQKLTIMKKDTMNTQNIKYRASSMTIVATLYPALCDLKNISTGAVLDNATVSPLTAVSGSVCETPAAGLARTVREIRVPISAVLDNGTTATTTAWEAPAAGLLASPPATVEVVKVYDTLLCGGVMCCLVFAALSLKWLGSALYKAVFKIVYYKQRPGRVWPLALAVLLTSVRITNAVFPDIDMAEFTSGAEGFRMVGGAGGDWYGNSVSGISDVNGDGIDDVAVSGYQADPLGKTDAGAVVVIYGNSPVHSYEEVDITAFDFGVGGFFIYGAAAGDYAGRSIAGAGDVNGDNIGDFIIGAFFADPGGVTDAGTAYVLFGRHTSNPFPNVVDLASFVSGAATGFKITGAGAGDLLGVSVSGAGDVNGDGYDDIIVGAHQADYSSRENAGAAYVIFGHNSTDTAFTDIAAGSFVTGLVGFRIYGAVAADLSGYSVSGAGDYSGDGYDDIIVGAFQADPPSGTDAGISYLIFGHSGTYTDIDLASFTSGAAGFRILGAQAGSQSGVSVCGVSDVNGDGYDDFMVGANLLDYSSRENAGAAYVIFGCRSVPAEDMDLATMVNGTLGFRIYGSKFNDQLGFSVSAAGDVNGDGFGDLLLATSAADALDRAAAGATIIIFGHSNSTTFPDIDTQSTLGELGYRIYGATAGDSFGFSVAAAGDVNNDGIDDFIVGAPNIDDGAFADAGAAYVIFGSYATPTSQPSSLPSAQPSRQPSRLPSAQPSSQPSVQPSSQPSNQPSAKPSRQPSAAPSQWVDPAYRDVDMAGFTSGAEGFRMVGGAADAQYGWSVSGIGDVNGDGIDDVAMGGPNADPLGRTDAGAVMVIYGHSTADIAFSEMSAAAVPSGSGFMIYGAAAGDGAGYSVAAVGDVNGDYIGDFIIGAYETHLGTAYVLFGRNESNPFPDVVDLASFVSGAATGFKVTGTAANDWLGNSVSGAGDMNGDGYDDILIGARQADPFSRTNAGAAYVIFGHNGTTTAFTDIAAGSFVTGIVGFKIYGATDFDTAGLSVSGAGDYNGDGYDDVIVGAPYADSPSKTNDGISYLIFGLSGAYTDIDLLYFTSGASGLRILGAQADDRSGISVSDGGDVNGDGYDDVVVGAQWHAYSGRVDAGAAYVIFGCRSVPTEDMDLATMAYGTLGFRIYGAHPHDCLGNSVSGAGDVNGDGIDDLAFGAFIADTLGRADAGSAVVTFGHSNSTTFPDIDTLLSLGELGYRIYGSTAGDKFGRSVSAAGDLNGDGIDDIIVGADKVSIDTFASAGAAYLLYGSYATPTSQPSSFPSSQPSSNPSLQPSRQPTTQPNGQPTGQPSQQPSAQPSCQPTAQPSQQPSTQPNGHPSSQPSSQPSGQPSIQPSSQPLVHPSLQPSAQPSSHPSQQPNGQPSAQPSAQPSTRPTRQPSHQPSSQPTCQPSRQPSSSPSSQPTRVPTKQPSRQPTSQPTMQPSAQPSQRPISYPSVQPSKQPSAQPTSLPSALPSAQPSVLPSMQPMPSPSAQPSCQPSQGPSSQPSVQPTSLPSTQPTVQPSKLPSSQPSSKPSAQPSEFPSAQPSAQPSVLPSPTPSMPPSVQPSMQPSMCPTTQPCALPSSQPSNTPSSVPSGQPISQPILPTMQSTSAPSQPSSQPSALPTFQPSVQPSTRPSRQPNSQPTALPSSQPSRVPTLQPTRQPTIQPTSQPSSQPSQQPLTQPSTRPTAPSEPSLTPSEQPSAQPTSAPSGQPSGGPTNPQLPCTPSSQPTGSPTSQPSLHPSGQPSALRTEQPSARPSYTPSSQPTGSPTSQPSLHPSGQPSALPTLQPSARPTCTPSSQPTGSPTSQPSLHPSGQPSALPTLQPSARPSYTPSNQPTSSPTSQPSLQPSGQPSALPTLQPSAQPTCTPSSQPTGSPTSQPSLHPSGQPSELPTLQPTQKPSSQASIAPSRQPTAQPSSQPTATPTGQPSSLPSIQVSTAPSSQPTTVPSAQPFAKHSSQPSSQPSVHPSSQPSRAPSAMPTVPPSSQPSSAPSVFPSSQPSEQPSGFPSALPSTSPTSQPSTLPTSLPSSAPTSAPTVARCRC